MNEDRKALPGPRPQTVIMAGGSWTTKHIVRDLPPLCRECIRPVPSLALPDGECSGAKFAISPRLGLTECQWFEGIGNSIYDAQSRYVRH